VRPSYLSSFVARSSDTTGRLECNGRKQKRFIFFFVSSSLKGD
jgi:hypothetical protein